MTPPAVSATQPPRAGIRAIAVALPETVESNEDLLEGLPDHVRDLLIRHIGVNFRHIARPDQTALDLGEQACAKLFAEHPDLPALVDVLIFCTQSPDYLLPSNACLLHGRLGLRDSVAAFDLPHACSAYVYAIGLAQALIASGAAGNVLLVTGDTYSRFIHPGDRATRLLFGDAAAATWLGVAGDGQGVLDVRCGTAGAYYDRFYIPAGGCRQPLTDALRSTEERDSSGNLRSPAGIHMAGREILSFVSSRVPAHIDEFLRRNGLVLDDVDWLVFHQASSVTLDSLVQFLNADPDKVIRYLADVGNTVSTSIPLALHNALERGLIRRGHMVLLCGFGAGLSWGSALLRW
jgi:3-oxoacyl-[acyl-carrier-protein] synthase-3